MGSCSLLQGIFPTQGSNPGLPHCRQILCHLSQQGSPRILEWVAYPFSRVSSRPRNWAGVSCIAGGFFTIWATGKALRNYSWAPGPAHLTARLWAGRSDAGTSLPRRLTGLEGRMYVNRHWRHHTEGRRKNHSHRTPATSLGHSGLPRRRHGRPESLQLQGRADHWWGQNCSMVTAAGPDWTSTGGRVSHLLMSHEGPWSLLEPKELPHLPVNSQG